MTRYVSGLAERDPLDSSDVTDCELLDTRLLLLLFIRSGAVRVLGVGTGATCHVTFLFCEKVLRVGSSLVVVAVVVVDSSNPRTSIISSSSFAEFDSDAAMEGETIACAVTELLAMEGCNSIVSATFCELDSMLFIGCEASVTSSEMGE